MCMCTCMCVCVRARVRAGGVANLQHVCLARELAVSTAFLDDSAEPVCALCVCVCVRERESESCSELDFNPC